MTHEEIWDDFLSKTCRVCGANKIQMQSFCRGCYRRLPSPMRQSLWQRFGEGYEEAFEAATRWFTENAIGFIGA